MARLVIHVKCPGDPFYQEAEIAAILLRFVARLLSWGNLSPGRTIDLTDYRGQRIGVARIEDEEQ